MALKQEETMQETSWKRWQDELSFCWFLSWLTLQTLNMKMTCSSEMSGYPWTVWNYKPKTVLFTATAVRISNPTMSGYVWHETYCIYTVISSLIITILMVCLTLWSSTESLATANLTCRWSEDFVTWRKHSIKLIIWKWTVPLINLSFPAISLQLFWSHCSKVSWNIKKMNRFQ